MLFEIAKGSWLKVDWQDLRRTATAENKVEQTSNSLIEGTCTLKEKRFKILNFFPAFSFKLNNINYIVSAKLTK